MSSVTSSPVATGGVCPFACPPRPLPLLHGAKRCTSSVCVLLVLVTVVPLGDIP